MEYYNLIFAVFHLWRLAITTLDKQSCFVIIIFAVFLQNNDSNIIFQSKWINFILEKYILEIKDLSCLTSNFLGFDFDL